MTKKSRSIKHCKKPGPKGKPHHLENIDQFYIDKFHSRCDHQPNGCIFIQGTTQNNGYKNWWYRYEEGGEKILRYITAHRFSAMISGKWSEAEVNEYSVLHHCDQYYENNDISYRQCVNPDHLWLGTVRDNIQDCIKKGRYVKPPRMLGEDNYNATLTTAQAEWVIENHYKISQRRMAEILNLNPSTIQAIHRNITWKHLDRP